DGRGPLHISFKFFIPTSLSITNLDKALCTRESLLSIRHVSCELSANAISIRLLVDSSSGKIISGMRFFHTPRGPLNLRISAL
ncbi:hypothetical protein VIGAN_09042900, partial [Vigna angularis var. angularis]